MFRPCRVIATLSLLLLLVATLTSATASSVSRDAESRLNHRPLASGTIMSSSSSSLSNHASRQQPSVVVTPTPTASMRASFQRMVLQTINAPLFRSLAAAAGTSLSLGSNLTVAQQSAYIATRYASSDKVSEVRSRVPRWGRTKEFTPESSEYQTMLVYQVIPGAVLFIMTLFIWIGYGIAQCCCCEPKHTGYTRRERLAPLVMGTLFALVALAFTIIGIHYTERFNTQLVRSGGLTDDASNVLTHVESFFSTLDSKLNQASVQVVETTGPNGQMLAVINNFTDVNPVLQDFLSNFKAFGKNVGDRSPLKVYQDDPQANPGSDNPISYACDFCTAFPDTVNGVADAIDQGATPVMQQITDTKTAAKTQVVDAQYTITSHIVDARSQVDDVRSKATKYQSDVIDYTDDVKKYEEIRRSVGLVIFLLPLLIVALWLVLVVGLRKEGGAKCLVCSMFPMAMVMWIVFLVHLPFAVLVADSCYYLDTKEPALATVDTFDVQMAATLTACLAKQNLLVPLDAADELDFGSQIIFPVVPSIDAILNTTAVADINTSIQSLTLEAFSPAYKTSTKQQVLDQLNSMTNVPPYNKYFGFNNVSSCNYFEYTLNATYSAQVRGYRNVVVTALSGEAQMLSLISEAQVNMSRIMIEFDSLKNQSVNLLNNMAKLEDTITPLLDAAQSVADSAFCSPLDDDYANMKAVYCDDVIVSVSAMAMASFFVAIFLGLANFSGWFLVHRLQHGSETVASFGVAIVTGSASGGGAGVLLSPTGANNPYVGGAHISQDHSLGVQQQGHGSDMELQQHNTSGWQ